MSHSKLNKQLFKEYTPLAAPIVQALGGKNMLQHATELKAIIKSMPVGIIVVDTQMNYLCFSNRYLQEHRLNEEDLIGKNHYDVVKDLPEHWKIGHKRCLTTGIPEKNDDDFFIRKNGTIEYLRWEIQPWKDELGHVQGLIMLLESLNDRKKAELAAIESEKRLSQVLSIIREGVWDWDIKNNTVWNNQRWAELLQLDKNITKHDFNFIQQIIHPDDFQPALDAVERALKGNGMFASEYRIITPNKEVVWIKDRGAVTERDEDGNPTRMVGSIMDITVQKNNAAKLKASSNLLIKLTNQVPGMIFQFLLDSQGKTSFPFVSDGAEEMLELTPEQLKNDASIGIPHMHTDDSKKILFTIVQSARTLKNWELDFRVQLPVKGLRWYRGIARPERLENGATLWHGSITDITDKKQVELEKEQYNKFFDSSNDAMCIADANQFLIKVNQAFYNILGYTRDELMAKPFLFFLHEDDIELTMTEMESKLHKGLPLKLENRFRAKNGNYIWFSWRAFMNFEEGLIYATGRDVTEKKKTELALIESEKNLQTIFELTPIPLIVTKLYEGTVMMANEATEALLGVNHVNVIGSNSGTLFMNEADRKKLQGELKRNGRAQFVEVVLKTTKQEPITCLVSCEIIYLKGEIALLSSIFDITDRKQYEEELINKNNELKKTNTELDKFVYSTSHDLRAPLLSVLGLIDLCEEGVAQNEMLFKAHQMMRSSIHRLDNTIKGILDYSRNTRIEPVFELLDVTDIINKLINNIKYMKEAHEVQFNLDINKTFSFYGDKMRFTSVLNNLITNAVKYQRSDEPCKEVNIKFNCNKEQVVLQVSDNGEGIPEDKMDRLFGMFVRLSSNSSGSGLGLYTSKEMIEKMGGSISVSNKKDQGTIFTVKLPNQIS